MQRELLDQDVWQSREELGQAIFEWIEAWYNPRRRHSGIGDVSPLEFENTHHAAIAAQFNAQPVSTEPGSASAPDLSGQSLSAWIDRRARCRGRSVDLLTFPSLFVLLVSSAITETTPHSSPATVIIP